jgi:hypothetical protein
VLSLSHQLATLVLEVAGIFGAVALFVALTLGRRPDRAELRFASAVVVGVLVVAVAVGEIPSGAALLVQANRESVPARGGVERCFGQGWPENPGGAGAARLPFVRWAGAQMGTRAVYALSYTAPPDPDCLYLGLLPALPAVRGEHADWTIAFGSIPAAMQARIVAHDPSVRVFAPGFALQFNGRR